MSRTWKLGVLFLFATSPFFVVALPDMPYLLYSNLTTIGSIDLDNYVPVPIISELEHVKAFDIDQTELKVYYAEHTNGTLHRVNMDGSGRELLLNDVRNVEGLAIDWVARLVYWTSYASKSVSVARLDGQYPKVLVHTDLGHPRGIALDPEEGFLFWSDIGNEAIERSTLAGENRTKLVNSDLHSPGGITIDYTTKKLYFIDGDTIYRIDYQGEQRTEIYEGSSYRKYYGFDLDINNNGDIYWSDWKENAIFGLKQTDPARVFKTIEIPSRYRRKGVMGVEIVDGSRQPQVTNRCGNNNGGCAQLCLLRPNGYKCACAAGFKLLEDGSCESAFKEEFILFADVNAGKLYQLETEYPNMGPVPIQLEAPATISRPVALDYDPVEDRVYWTDIGLRKICRAFRNGSSFEIVLDDDIGTADGLALDLAGRNLFWTTKTFDRVEVSRMDGSHRRILISSDLEEPRGILVDPLGGYFYWSDRGKRAPKIERAYMDGSHREQLVNTEVVQPNALTIDHDNNMLYWADAKLDTIETLDLKTRKRDVLINEKFFLRFFRFTTSDHVLNPLGMTLFHSENAKYLVWTEFNTRSIYRANSSTGADVTLLASGLDKPIDIHAYSKKPKQGQRVTYTFIFPNRDSQYRGSTFTCYRSKHCPSKFGDPPACPSGYTSVRVRRKCGLQCRNVVGNTYRCPCRNWFECAIRKTYAMGCRGWLWGRNRRYVNYKVRECVQAVRPGRCPYQATKGSLQSCINDESCPGSEKCCEDKCTTATFIATHPCQTDNGHCETLCLSIPGGYKCRCRAGYAYDQTTKSCVLSSSQQPPSTTQPTTMTIAPTIAPTPGLCDAIASPTNGQSSCEHSAVQVGHSCTLQCNEGYVLMGYPELYCHNNGWSSAIPTCVERDDPTFSSCPVNISVSADPGVATKYVNWVVPTATDHEGDYVSVTVQPSHVTPPVRLSIGTIRIVYTATDDEDGTSVCAFTIEVKDEEAPSFGNTCPSNIIKYVDTNDGAIVTWVEPTATDNSGVSPTITKPSTGPGSKFSVGTTTLLYKATDAAGLVATCSFRVQVINVCASVSCTFGAQCRLKGVNTYDCVCDTTCTKEYTPVCGSDGKTYSNECSLRAAQCVEKKSITVVSTGACKRDNPSFSSCPVDISVSTDPGVATKNVHWVVPTATDHEKRSLTVTVNPSLTPPATMSIGTTKIIYTATDAKGLTSTCQFVVEVKDEEAPSFGNTCPSNIIKYVDTNDGATVTWVEPTATDNSGASPTITKPSTGPGSKFSVGTTTLLYKATDAAGLLATCSFRVQVINVCSSVTCSFGAECQLKDVSSYHCVCTIVCDTDKYVPVCGSDGKTYSNQCYVRKTQCNERRSITVISTGACRRDEPSFSSCPADIIVSTDPGVATKNVHWVVPTATDHEGRSLTAIVNPSLTPPATMSIGTTTIVYTATDAKGLTSTCQFVVEVNDEEPPSFGNTCPSNIIKYVDTNDGAIVTWVEPTATDNSGASPAITKPSTGPGSKFSVGITTLLYKATDAAGLLATCSFQVRVINVCSSATCSLGAECQLKDVNSYHCVCTSIVCDTDEYAPVCGSDGKTYSNQCYLRKAQCNERQSITVISTGACKRDEPGFSSCPADITVSTDPGVATKNVHWVVPTATDHEGRSLTAIVNPSLTPPATMSIGTTTIVYTATDAKGLTSTCQFIIEVKDEEPPSFGNTCPSNIIKYVDTNDGAIITWVEPTATDNSGASPTITKPSTGPGSKFSVGTTTLLYKATDAAGLLTTCSFRIRVINVCFSIRCNFGACQLRSDNSYHCVCDFACTMLHQPVCGSDGKTYSNECVFRKAKCDEKKSLSVSYTGVCVKDNPVFSTCPGNITVATDVGLPSKTVSWSVPTATDYKGASIGVNVDPPSMKPPVTLNIGTTKVVYKTTDDEGHLSVCQFFIQVKDEEPPSFGNTCPSNMIKYVNTNDGAIVTWVEPTATDNSGASPTITKPNTGPGSKFSVGTTTLLYKATDAAGLLATCSFQVQVINVCSSVTCDFGAQCHLTSHNSFHCVCDAQCITQYKPVCGSDGVTYSNECALRRQMCIEKKVISVIATRRCDCEMSTTSDFEKSSSISCSLNDNSVLTCDVTCREGYRVAIDEFLKIRCHKGKWVRANTVGKFVPINTLPQCQEQKNKIPGLNRCPVKHQALVNVCVQCSPGSYYDENSAMCKECYVTKYQDLAAQSRCKSCNFPTITRTSTTIGAESCFADIGGSTATVVTNNMVSTATFQKDIANALTRHCQTTTCSFNDNRRKKRNSDVIMFEEDDVIVLSVHRGTKITMIVLDPNSNDIVPDKTLTSKKLEELLLAIVANSASLHYIKSVNDKPAITAPSAKPKKETKSNSSKVPAIAIVLPVVLLVLLVLAAAVLFLYGRHRRNSRPATAPPTVHFQRETNERETNNHIYEEPGPGAKAIQFKYAARNRLYDEVSLPPPYSSISRSKDAYAMSNGAFVVDLPQSSFHTVPPSARGSVSLPGSEAGSNAGYYEEPGVMISGTLSGYAQPRYDQVSHDQAGDVPPRPRYSVPSYYAYGTKHNNK